MGGSDHRVVIKKILKKIQVETVKSKIDQISEVQQNSILKTKPSKYIEKS